MFLHVFLFRWKAGTANEDKARAATAIAKLREEIPQVLEAHAGTNLSPRGGEYTFGGVMRFHTQDDFHAYEVHPAHQALLAWLVPLIEPLELDLLV